MCRTVKSQCLSGCLLLMAAMLVGCSPAKDTNSGSVAAAPEVFDEELFSDAIVKRDDNGHVISFQLRDQSSPPSLETLGQLQKLRSVVPAAIGR